MIAIIYLYLYKKKSNINRYSWLFNLAVNQYKVCCHKIKTNVNDYLKQTLSRKLIKKVREVDIQLLRKLSNIVRGMMFLMEDESKLFILALLQLDFLTRVEQHFFGTGELHVTAMLSS